MDLSQSEGGRTARSPAAHSTGETRLFDITVPASKKPILAAMLVQERGGCYSLCYQFSQCPITRRG
jgi:hypothetical protein